MVPAEADVTITGIRMPPGHATEGLEAARVIREELPGTAIIVLSADVEVNEAMDLPAGGVVHRLPAEDPGDRRDGDYRDGRADHRGVSRWRTRPWCRNP
jgi:CheY-like chemotaxis protein